MRKPYTPKSGDFVRCHHYVTAEELQGFYIGLMDSRYGGVHWVETKYGKTGVRNLLKLSKKEENEYRITLLKDRLKEELGELRSAYDEYQSRRSMVKELRDEIKAYRHAT